LHTHQPLRHGDVGNEEDVGHLFRGEAAKCAQSQGNLPFDRERGVAAGEDEAEAIVFNFGIAIAFRLGNKPLQFRIAFAKTGVASQPVDGFMAGRADDPRARIRRYAAAIPLRESGGESLLHHVFGEIEVLQEADERGQNAVTIAPE
jgi:hypothetical protein